MRISYRVEIQPTSTQLVSLLQHAGNARWAYNWGLQKCKESHALWVEAGKPKGWKWPNAMSLHKELNLLKKIPVERGGVPWMHEASKCAPQEALRNLDKAFQGFFRNLKKGKKSGYPKFKSRNKGVGGFTLVEDIRAFEKSIQLPRLGRVRVKPGDHGYVPEGPYKQATVKEHSGRWFVSVTCSQDVVEAKPNGGPVVGLDLGVVKLVTLSDGTAYENPRPGKRLSSRVKKAQKSVSRKVKGSSNRRKAKKTLAKLLYRVANQRKDVLHKMTTKLTKNHSRIFVEDLKVQNMVRSGGAHKKGLNRVLLDSSFGEIRRMLEYKGKLYGCEVVAVNPAYTSQKCSMCGYTDAGNRRSQSDFECLRCSFTLNADVNAARNILAAGSCPEAVNACGADVRQDNSRVTLQLASKQESVEGAVV